MSNHSVLSLNAVGFERDDIPLFSGVCETLNEGEILQIEGPNGVGKTTLIKILATVLTPITGEVSWQGKAITNNSYDYLSELLFIGHTSGVAASLTPRENLVWWLNVQGIQCDDMDALFNKIGLRGFADVPCYTLSAGQARRVALVRLLVCKSKVWVLDEPFTAIDKDGCDYLASLLVEHAQQGGMVIFSSHQNLGIDGVRSLNLAHYKQEVAF